MSNARFSINIDLNKIQENFEQYHFQIGVFPEKNTRFKVSHKKSSFIEIKKLSAKYNNKSYRQVFRSPKEVAKITNAQLFQYEIEKGRNYLLDCFSPRSFDNMMKITKMFESFIIKRNDLNMQQACQELVRMVRVFIESNPYGMHNAISTIKQKHQDAWFRDSRQAQISVGARFMSKQVIIASDV